MIVANRDRSGHSNFSSVGKGQLVLEVTCEYIDAENNIAVYSIPDNPADCVLIGLGGFFEDDTPDLVISGINSGSNIGRGWFASGTIGAVRTATFLGVKAVAFSGFDADLESSYKVIPKWINEFISSDLIGKMSPGEYLTVGIPRIPPKEIKGVKFSDREINFDSPAVIEFQKVYGEDPHQDENKTVWAIVKYGEPELKKDEKIIDEGYIVVTPMSLDENAPKLFNSIMELKIPAFEGNE